MLFIRFSLLLVAMAMAGCGKDANHRGKATALTIVASFPESESGDKQLSLAETAPSETVARETSTNIVSQPNNNILRLGEDLAGAEKVFAHKGAFRWFSYTIYNGDKLLKSDSIEINDPSLAELKPIEVSAQVGDKLSLKLSFMQVDFQSESDAKNFCGIGSIGFVRTWDASSEQTVDDSGVISLNFEESGRTAVTMAAIKISQDQLKIIGPETLKSTLLNEHTGFRLSEGVCSIDNIYPNFESTDRFLKVMTFSRPLKSMQLMHFNDNHKIMSFTEIGGWKAFLDGFSQPNTQREIGVSAAFNVDVESNDTGWNLVPASFTDVLPPKLSPRLPLFAEKPEAQHATRPTLKGNYLRFDATGGSAEKVKVELLTLGNASAVCNSGNPIATYVDYQEDAIDIPVLLGQGAGTYMLRIRTTFADKTQVCSTTPLKIDVPAFIPDTGVNKIASGENHTCAISGGQLYCWGQNNSGQVTGTGSNTGPAATILIPTLVAGLGTKAHAVFAGPNHTCAIIDVNDTEQAIAKCWGENFTQPGIDPFFSIPTGATHMIATSSSFTCAVPKSDGTNETNSFCINNASTAIPVSSPIPGLTNTADIQVAMSTDGLCIAEPNNPIMCVSFSGNSVEPSGTQVGEAGTFHLVSDGVFFFLNTAEQVVRTWTLGSAEGLDESAELVTQILPDLKGSTSIHASNGNVCAVKDGMPICWGKNSGGQFIVSENLPIPAGKAQIIKEIDKPTQLSLGGGHVCVTSGAAGNLRCWGRNAEGQLGINRTTISGEPAMTFFNVVEPLKAPTGTAAPAGIDPQNDNTVGLNSDTSQLSTQ